MEGSQVYGALEEMKSVPGSFALKEKDTNASDQELPFQDQELPVQGKALSPEELAERLRLRKEQAEKLRLEHAAATAFSAGLWVRHRLVCDHHFVNNNMCIANKRKTPCMPPPTGKLQIEKVEPQPDQHGPVCRHPNPPSAGGQRPG